MAEPIQRMFYSLLRAALFRIDAERAHELTLAALRNPVLAAAARRMVGPIADDPAGG